MYFDRHIRSGVQAHPWKKLEGAVEVEDDDLLLLVRFVEEIINNNDLFYFFGAWETFKEMINSFAFQIYLQVEKQ